MYARLIQPGANPNVAPLWHCITGLTPDGYNCVPGGSIPTRGDCWIGIVPLG